MTATNCLTCKGGPFHFIEHVYVSGGVRSKFVCTAPEIGHCRVYPDCECGHWEDCDHPDVMWLSKVLGTRPTEPALEP